MKNIFALGLVLFGIYTVSIAQTSNCHIQRYNLNIIIDFEKKVLSASSDIIIINDSQKEISSLSVLLYRLFEVHSITTLEEKSVPFVQAVRPLTDFESFNANVINLELKDPIYPGTSRKLTFKYSGRLLGYAETGISYLNDHIDPSFTIIRPECLVYPIIGEPEISTLKAISSQNFEYNIQVTVPDSLYVVNGGQLTSKSSKNNYSTFTYRSLYPTYQIVTTIANYHQLKTSDYSTFYFLEDSIHARDAHQSMLRTIDLYTEWWGPLRSKGRFSLIEIPENYGSQTTENYIIQTASAFNDPNQLQQLYHEISHLWNVKPTDEYPSRWNEGLATFIEYKTVEHFTNQDVLHNAVTRVIENLRKNPLYKEIPFVNYGRENVTDRSYSVGFVFFYILHRVIGTKTFNEVIKTYYKEYYTSGATINDFLTLVESTSGMDLSSMFEDWIFTTSYFELLSRGVSLDDFVQKYK